jgi:hypothetical protein
MMEVKGKERLAHMIHCTAYAVNSAGCACAIWAGPAHSY